MVGGAAADSPSVWAARSLLRVSLSVSTPGAAQMLLPTLQTSGVGRAIDAVDAVAEEQL